MASPEGSCSDALVTSSDARVTSRKSLESLESSSMFSEGSAAVDLAWLT